MKNVLLFDNLKDFQSSTTTSMTYWSWEDSAHNDTRQVMGLNAIKNSSADYLRAEAYAGNSDFSIIGKDYAHVSPMGAIEWCWPIHDTTRWYISIDMYFIYSHCQSRQVVELWQDDVLLWRRGFTVNLPVADCLILDTNVMSGEIRLLVLSETKDIAYGTFIYRLKLYQCDVDSQVINFKRKTQLLLPQKNQMFAGLDKLPPHLQRKLYEVECATDHLTSHEKAVLQQTVTAKALQQLNLTERIFGESGFYKLK